MSDSFKVLILGAGRINFGELPCNIDVPFLEALQQLTIHLRLPRGLMEPLSPSGMQARFAAQGSCTRRRQYGSRRKHLNGEAGGWREGVREHKGVQDTCRCQGRALRSGPANVGRAADPHLRTDANAFEADWW